MMDLNGHYHPDIQPTYSNSLRELADLLDKDFDGNIELVSEELLRIYKYLIAIRIGIKAVELAKRLREAEL